jgi:hypothetical protein
LLFILVTNYLAPMMMQDLPNFVSNCFIYKLKYHPSPRTLEKMTSEWFMLLLLLRVVSRTEMGERINRGKFQNELKVNIQAFS